ICSRVSVSSSGQFCLRNSKKPCIGSVIVHKVCSESVSVLLHHSPWLYGPCHSTKCLTQRTRRFFAKFAPDDSIISALYFGNIAPSPSLVMQLFDPRSCQRRIGGHGLEFK